MRARLRPPRSRAVGRGLRALLALGVVLGGSAAAASEEAELEARAALFRQALVGRHLAPEGLVLYRVNLATLAQDLATGHYPNLADTPTFTGLFAATSCVRAAVDAEAGRREALADAGAALAGLRFLLDVTGERGLLARGARRATAPADDEGERKWFQGCGPFAGYRWRGDASLDQYANGLLPAVAECRTLFPGETRSLVVDFARHLLEHDMRIVDADGEVTTYGDLSWRSGLGWNSIAQLVAYTALTLAAELDGDPRFAQARDRLREVRLVPFRSRITNLRVLGITNHSNDLMAWNLYRALVPLARSGGDPALPALRHGLLRTWLRVRPDGNPYFAAVFCRVEPERCDRAALAAGRALLARFPTEKRKLAPSPELERLPRRLLPGRKGHARARQLVPIELRPVSSFEWKSSPYRVAGGTAPEIEYTGLDFLSAYWLLRFVEAGPVAD